MPLPPVSMSAMHLAGSALDPSSKWEPQRANNGLLEFYSIPRGVGGEITVAQTFILAMESFKIPNQSNNPLELMYMNNAVKYAGRATVDDFDCVFRDFADQRVGMFLNRWRGLVYNMFGRGTASPQRTAQIGYAANYKANAVIWLFGPDGHYQRAIELEGIWPQMLDHGEVSQDNDDVLRLNVTFSIDRVLPYTSEAAAPLELNLRAADQLSFPSAPAVA